MSPTQSVLSMRKCMPASPVIAKLLNGEIRVSDDDGRPQAVLMREIGAPPLPGFEKLVGVWG
jgi:hypothetical protein